MGGQFVGSIGRPGNVLCVWSVHWQSRCEGFLYG